MFDRVKKAFVAKAERVREVRAHPGPADLSALPPGTGAVDGLGSVAPAVVGAYVGLEVRTIRPLDRLGPESSGLLADKLRSRMRSAGFGDPDLAPGEIIPGQNAARMARLRAEGLDEAQLALIQQKIVEATEAQEKTGWTIEFANGNRASVQLFELDSSDSDFTRLKSQYEAQHTRAGAHSMQNNMFEFAVHRIDNSPYEAYYKPGALAARGRAHEVNANASHLGTMQLDQTLAALAILALHSLEGS
jgi:hypothetical protein